MQALSDIAAEGAFDVGHYPAICLFCLVDWIDMRQLFDFDGFKPLLDIQTRHGSRPMVAATNPRNAG